MPKEKHKQQNTSNRRCGSPRRAAAAALVRVHKGGWANLAAKELFDGMSQQDTAFASALFYGSAERLVTLDALLAPFSKKPLHKLDAEVRAVLETGLYQLLYMQVPQSAAVNESVKLARSFGKSSAAGFINAVLRRCAAGYSPDDPLAGLPKPRDEADRVSLRYSVSRPVAEALIEGLPDEYEAFLQACFSNPALCVRANTLQNTAQQLAVRLETEEKTGVKQGSLPDALYLAAPRGVAHSPLFKAGAYHVQGEASQYACAALQALPGHTVLDLCAAPGGKSATLAQYIGGGAGLTACDIHPHRVALIRQTLARLGISGAKTLQNDAAVYNPALGQFDRVLCDVPCSGLGLLAKKPDIRLADGAAIRALPSLQMEILNTAARYVKQGGRLVYSTCTVLPAENEKIVEAFLLGNPAFRAVRPKLVPEGALFSGETVKIMPQLTGLDGFYVASLERIC